MEKKKRERHDGVWKDPDSGIWRYRFMFKGKRYFGADPLWKNKTEAKAARDKRRIAVREGRDETIASFNTNFKAFVEEDTFLPWVKLNMAAQTHRGYAWRAARLVKAFGCSNSHRFRPSASRSSRRRNYNARQNTVSRPRPEQSTGAWSF